MTTYDLLLLLAVCLKKSLCTKREGPIFLGDKSAAFDSINYLLIEIALKRIRVDPKFIATYMHMLRNLESRVITGYCHFESFLCSIEVAQGGVESTLIGNLAYDIGLARLKKENTPFLAKVFSYLPALLMHE
jgi:hypothetical protein